MTLEWSTVAASQLAVAAVTARRPGTTASIAPGLLVALVWLTAGAAPTLHRHLHEVRSHAVTWCALLTAALATIIAASQEGGGRRRGGALTR
jgi:hypothetical protein